MRISYNTPPNKEGASALHEAVQAGRTDLVRYLLEKGANPELVDGNGKKPIDLVGAGGDGGRGRGGAPADAAAVNIAGRGAGAASAAGAGGRGGAGGGGVSPATAAEIRAMLQDAASKTREAKEPLPDRNLSVNSPVRSSEERLRFLQSGCTAVRRVLVEYRESVVEARPASARGESLRSCR